MGSDRRNNTSSNNTSSNVTIKGEQHKKMKIS